MVDTSSDFYVRIHSSDSFLTYPANTQSSFQVALPKPLELKKKYEVSLVNIVTDRVVGSKNDVEKPIIITSTELNDEDLFDMIKGQGDLKFASYQYFKSFLDYDYYDMYSNSSIWGEYIVNDTRKLAFRSGESGKTTNIKIMIEDLNLDDEFKGDSVSEEFVSSSLPTDLTVKLARNEEYSMKELLKHYLFGFIDWYVLRKRAIMDSHPSPNSEEGKRITNQLGRIETKIQKLMHIKATELIKTLRTESQKMKVNKTFYFGVYTDLISSVLTSQGFSKCCYFGLLPSQGNSVNIINLQYFPVDKSYIRDISVTIRDHLGNEVLFGESNTDYVLPSCLTFHFRVVKES